MHNRCKLTTVKKMETCSSLVKIFSLSLIFFFVFDLHSFCICSHFNLYITFDRFFFFYNRCFMSNTNLNHNFAENFIVMHQKIFTCTYFFSLSIHLVSKRVFFIHLTQKNRTFWSCSSWHSRRTTISFFSKTFWNTIGPWASTISSGRIWYINNIVRKWYT